MKAKGKIQHDYVYIIISSVYEHWSDDSFDIEYTTLSLGRAKDKLEEFRRECELSAKDDSDKYVRKYRLYRYKLDGSSRELIDKCDNVIKINRLWE